MTWEFTPRDVARLLTPSFLAARNRRLLANRSDFLRAALFGGVTIVFSLGIFAAFYRMLIYIGRFSEFTAPLTHQILATVSVFLFTVLLASNIITAYSTQYVSDDLSLLASSPVPLPALYGSRLTLTLFQSSWMVLVFSIPVYLAFAVTSLAPMRFLLAVVLVLPPLLIIPAALGSMTTSVLVSVFPARRVRELLMMIGALFVVLIVFLIRTQQPERLLNPSSIYDVGEFFSAFRTPASPLLPSTWPPRSCGRGVRRTHFPGSCFCSYTARPRQPWCLGAGKRGLSIGGGTRGPKRRSPLASPPCLSLIVSSRSPRGPSSCASGHSY